MRKKKSALLAACLALTLVLTGTFAWTSFSQRAINELEKEVDHGGRVHDDFDGENKDIYAENYGTSDLYVRIKLTEYMEINGTPLVTGTSKVSKETWIPNVLGTKSVYADYVTWTMGGEKVYMPTLNTDPENLSTDATGIAIDDLTRGQTAEGDGSHAYWTVGDPNSAALTSTGEVSKPATNTLSPEGEGYMTMAKWVSDGKPTGNFWVVDVDGWAYWATRLAPGEATSLLLDSIEMTSAPDEDWYYAINVIGEFATLGDIDKFEGASSNAKELLHAATGKNQYALEITQESDSVVPGETHQLTVKVTDGGKEVTSPTVTYKIVSGKASGTSVDRNGLVTVAADETNKSLIVRATYTGSVGTVFNDVTFRVTK